MMHRTIVLLIPIICIIQGNNGFSESARTPINTSIYASSHRCVWLPCPVDGYPSPWLNYSLDCCSLEVPLDYSGPNRTISISMSRLSPVQRTAENNTLFILMGGPGQSGWILLQNTARIIPASFGLTLIFPDHRGTGLSTALGCDEDNSQTITTDCVTYLKSKWGIDGLNQFSITAAVHDLSVQIQSYQIDHPGRISVYGLSYGTLLLDRFLQIYPALVQSAVMDGVINPYLMSISRYDLWASSVASQFLTYCQTNPDCSQYFPSDQPPAIMLFHILNDLDSNKQQCIQKHFLQYQFTSNWFRISFFYLMQSGDQYIYRTVLPAVIFRLYRCSDEDVTALNFFFRIMTNQIEQTKDIRNGPAFLFSNVLNCNIVQSELWLALNESEVDNETIIAWHKSTIMSAGNGEHLISIRDQWPKYPVDRYRNQIASYSPLLMISGQLDAATVFDQVSLLASMTTKTRTFYGIPLAGHGTLYMASAGYYCPLRLICSWAFPDLFPMEWRDPACIRQMPTTIDFVGTTKLVQQSAMFFLGTSEPFGNHSFKPIFNLGVRSMRHARFFNVFYISICFLFHIVLIRVS